MTNTTMATISICDFLKLIVKSTVKHYTEDFKLDIKIFKVQCTRGTNKIKKK